MQKIVFILLIIFFSGGCSLYRKSDQSVPVGGDKFDSGKLIKSIQKQNISKSGFFIEKAEIEIIGKDGSEKYLASLKFQYPDKYLISLRNTAGIEGVRALVSRDTLLVNDRLNKVHYYGSPHYISTKFGFSVFVLPIIFGDLVSDNDIGNSPLVCTDGRGKIEVTIKGTKVNYLVDCSKQKILQSIIENSINVERIRMEYSRFENIGDLILPEDISILDKQRSITIKIKVKKVQAPWNGTVDFIPGKNYEILQLL